MGVRMASERTSCDRGTETALGTPSGRVVFPVLLILGAALVGNLNVLFAGFVWDDWTVIVNNSAIRHWDTLPTVFTQTFLASYYRPVVTLSFALERAVWGLRPFGFHLTNLLLHGANAVLAFAILKRVSRNADAALLGALLFAAHPAHKGIVNIADRTGMLAAFLYLGALVLYIGYRDSKGSNKGWLRYGASVILCALALFSKEEALTLPAIVILTDWFLFPEELRRNRIRSAALYVPFVLLPLLYLWVRHAVGMSMGGMAEAFAVEPFRRLLTIPRLMLNYIFLLAFPLNLDFNPRTPLAASGVEFSAWTAVAATLLILASIPWLLKRCRPAAFGLLWFFIAFVPMSNIVPILPEAADTQLFTPIHFLYLPSIGLFLCAGLALKGTLDRFGSARVDSLGRRGTVLFLVIVVMAFSLLSLKRNATWKNEIRLFRYIARMHPEDSGMRVNLGNAYLAAGNVDDAVAQLEQAVALEPETAETHNALGLAYFRKGDTGSAIVEFRESIRLEPNDAGPYSNLAVAYVRTGRLPEAIAAAERAVELEPSSPAMHTNLGLIYKRAGRLDEAEEQFLMALDNDADDAEAHNALGALYAARKEYGKARRHWEETLRIRPDLRSAREGLDGLNRMGR